MSVTLGDAILNLKTNNAELSRGLDAAGQQTKGWANDLGGVLKNALSFAISNVIVGGIKEIGGAIAGLGKEALDAYAKNERLELSLENLVVRAAKQVFQTVPKMSAEASGAIAEVETKHAETLGDIAEKAIERAADIYERMGDQRSEYNAREKERERELGERLTELSERHAERETEIKKQLDKDDKTYAEKAKERKLSLVETLTSLAEKHAERETAIKEKLDDTDKTYTEKAKERRETLTETLAGLAEQHVQKEADINASKEDEITRFTESAEERKYRLDKKMADLKKRLKEASTEKERVRLKEQITETGVEAKREEAQAKKEHDRKLAQLDARLKKEEEEYKKAQEKAKKRADEELEEMGKAHTAQVKLLKERLTKEDTEYQKAQDKAKQRSDKELAEMKKAHDAQVVLLKERLAQEDAANEKAGAKLQRDFDEATVTRKRAFDAQVKANQKALAEIETDRKKALDKEADDFQKQMLKTRGKFSLVELGQVAPFKAAIDKVTPSVKDLLKWITQLAVKSPFKQEEVASAFRMAMAYGFTTSESQRLTQAMIDFASGSGATGASMERITLALGQIRAKGKLAGQEMLQLTEAGLPVGEILAKAFGKTTAEIESMREKGLIPAQDAIDAIVQSLETDFAGAAERQATSFSGLISTLEDIKSIGLREFFTGTFQAIQPYLAQFADFFSSEATMATIRAWGDKVGGVLGGILGRLKAGFDRDGIRGVLDEAGAMLKEGWDTFIWPKLQEWGGKFWEWVTGKGGAKEGVPGMLGQLTDAISNFLKTDWPKIEGTLNEWRTKIFDWISTFLVPELKKKLDEVSRGIKEWSEAPENKTKIQEIGKTIGTAIRDGLDILIKNVEFWTPIMLDLGTALAKALATAMPAIVNNVGASLREGLIEGLFGGAPDFIKNYMKNLLGSMSKLEYGPLIPLYLAGASVQTAMGNQAPGRAGGGSVFGGIPSLVGEGGPELFWPGQNGTITPNNSLAELIGTMRALMQTMAASASRPNQLAMYGGQTFQAVGGAGDMMAQLNSLALGR